MKILIPGHRYQLSNFERNGTEQTIQFIEKVPKQVDSTELVTVNNGTTNEQVLAVLINRLEYLNDKFPCEENRCALEHLDDALFQLNLRTSKRKVRGVEGKQIK